MTKEEKKECLSWVQIYRDDIQNECGYWCNTCKFGVIVGLGDGHTCPFDLIITEIENEIYE